MSKNRPRRAPTCQIRYTEFRGDGAIYQQSQRTGIEVLPATAAQRAAWFQSDAALRQRVLPGRQPLRGGVR